MKIQLLSDFRGTITDEQYYVAGVYEGGVNMPPSHAQALVADNRAVIVEDDKPEPAAAPKRRRRKKAS